MAQQILEGTWEEIALHAAELSGRRVRLTILTEQQSENAVTPEETLDKMLLGRVGKVNFQPSNLSENTGKAFTDIVAEKYKKQGSDL